MTVVSLLALFFSMLGFPIGMPRMTFPKLFFVTALWCVHIGTAILAYLYTLSHLSDSHTYYYDTWNVNHLPWYSLSTVFVVHITQLFKNYLGATYFDCFMIFQMFGFWGLMVVLRTFEEIHARIVVPGSAIAGSLLFLPGLHFWTSGLGKDGIAFLALALCTWSALNPSKRILQFALAMLLLILVRVHIAIVAAACLVIALALYRNLSLGKRVALLMPALAALIVVAVIVKTSLGIDVADAGSIQAFYESASSRWEIGAGNTSLYGQPFYIKLISLLARPMFFDAGNILGVVASGENVLLLLVAGYGLAHYRQLRELYRSVYFVRFAAILTVSLVLLLAATNYNVGLGLRQRTMFLPPLLSIFVAIWDYRSRIKRERQRPSSPPVAASPAVPAMAATASSPPMAPTA